MMKVLYAFEPETFGLAIFIYTDPFAVEFHLAWWSLSVCPAAEDDDA